MKVKRRIKNVFTLKEYINSIDGCVLEVTNAYELIRFLTNKGITCVIYNGKKGINFSNEEARNIYKKYKKGHIELENPNSKFKSEKRKIRKYINSFDENDKKSLYKFICDGMGYKKSLRLTIIDNLEELRDIYRLINQYKRLFCNNFN